MNDNWNYKHSSTVVIVAVAVKSVQHHVANMMLHCCHC